MTCEDNPQRQPPPVPGHSNNTRRFRKSGILRRGDAPPTAQQLGTAEGERPLPLIRWQGNGYLGKYTNGLGKHR